EDDRGPGQRRYGQRVRRDADDQPVGCRQRNDRRWLGDGDDHKRRPRLAQGESDHAHPPEHERLQCVEGANWVCQYSKVPEPALDFQWTPQDGAFIGLLTPLGQWTCPSWFPSVICANANRVAQGTRSFEPVSNGTIREALIIT